MEVYLVLSQSAQRVQNLDPAENHHRNFGRTSVFTNSYVQNRHTYLRCKKVHPIKFHLHAVCHPPLSPPSWVLPAIPSPSSWFISVWSSSLQFSALREEENMIRTVARRCWSQIIEALTTSKSGGTARKKTPPTRTSPQKGHISLMPGQLLHLLVAGGQQGDIKQQKNHQ